MNIMRLFAKIGVFIIAFYLILILPEQFTSDNVTLISEIIGLIIIIIFIFIPLIHFGFRNDKI